MDESESIESTLLLRAWANGDQGALERLMPRVYQELRRITGQFMKHEKPGRTLQATALVHEAFLKLIAVNDVDWECEAHFFAIAAQIMRRILLDAARKRAAAKTGGKAVRVNLDEAAHLGTDRANQLIALDEALNRLEKVDPRKARVIELRFFGGLSMEETATILKVSQDTILRDWRLARAWLLAELSE